MTIAKLCQSAQILRFLQSNNTEMGETKLELLTSYDESPETLPYGKYRAKPIPRVPTRYLQWAAAKMRPDDRELHDLIDAELSRRAAMGGGADCQFAVKMVTAHRPNKIAKFWSPLPLSENINLETAKNIIDYGLEIAEEIAGDDPFDQTSARVTAEFLRHVVADLIYVFENNEFYYKMREQEAMLTEADNAQ